MNNEPLKDESIEQQLRRQVEDLKRQLREREEAHAGSPAHPPAGEIWKPSGVTISALVLGLAVLLIGAFFAGYLPLQRRDASVRAEAQEHGKDLPRMEVMRVGRASNQSELTLPGTLQAVTEAPILARADGYLKSRLVDLGDRVRAGQPLAEIDAPELDQQILQAQAAIDQAQASLEQAEASLEQGKSNRNLAKITADRYKTLLEQESVSRQDNDQYQAQLVSQNANVQALEKAVSAQRSNLAASKANLARLQQVTGYRVVKAPFDGVITLRNVDVGALVSTGTTLLYRIAQSGTLRTYINVPQENSGSIRLGRTRPPDSVELSGAAFPRQGYAYGECSRSGKPHDAGRNRRAERGWRAVARHVRGSRFKWRCTQPAPLVPAQALLIRSAGAQVAVVAPDGIVHLRKVAVGRDYGDRVEIVQGVEEGATILNAPGEEAQEGARIVPVSGANAKP